ncbi:hypothetical protein VP501E541_P0130 [Vibrio phage 501E54-1]|nr:hypothetical protein VP501E541_P0130 [Vibrio phage 501E54-1]
MTILLETTDTYAITATREEEHMDMYEHFVGECGWSEERFENIEDYDFFSVKIELTVTETGETFETYLGACCAITFEREVENKIGGYLPQMIEEVKNEYLESL